MGQQVISANFQLTVSRIAKTPKKVTMLVIISGII